MSALLVRALAASLLLGHRHDSRISCDDPRILVIRRNRMGDMICTLPLLRTLRRRFPAGHLAVACDAAGAPIAQACSAVDRVILLRPGLNRWTALVGNARGLQEFDWVIAAKAGFDKRLAFLTRLTNAARRIGYENGTASKFYTDPVAIPADLWRIHQIEATLGLLAPLGVEVPVYPVPDLQLDLPAAAIAFAEALAPFWKDRRLVLVNVSSTSPLRFRDEDFAALVTELSSRADLAVGLVGLPADLPRAHRLAEATAGRARVLPTPGPLELAALVGQAHLLITGEGGAAHLAAAMGTLAVVLWSEGPFEKWYSRGPRHAFVRLEPGEGLLPLDRVRAALAPYLESERAPFVP
jgi:heptosyltransferase III